MRSQRLVFTLVALAIVVTIVRVIFTNELQVFSLDSYYAFRQLDHMTMVGEPFFQDELSFLGRDVFVPLYIYGMFVLSQLFGTYAGSAIFMQIFFLLGFLVSLLLVTKLTKWAPAVVLTALCYLLSPFLLQHTVGALSASLGGAVLCMVSIYFLYRVKETDSFLYYILALVSYLFAVMLTPYSYIALLLWLFYYLFALSFARKFSPIYLQYWLVCVVLSSWLVILMYKEALLFHGLDILYGNIPQILRSTSLFSLNVVSTIGLLGLFPLLFATYALLVQREKRVLNLQLIIFCFVFVYLLCGLLTIVPIQEVILFLSLPLYILAGKGFSDAKNYFSKTNFSRFTKVAVSLTLIISVIPMLFTQIALIEDKFVATAPLPMLELSSLDPDGLYVIEPEFSQYFMYVLQRKTFLDTNYLLVANPTEYYERYAYLQTTPFVANVLLALDGHVTTPSSPAYIVTPEFNADRATCVRQVGDALSIYEVTCRLGGAT